jgi:hypothetical protein
MGPSSRTAGLRALTAAAVLLAPCLARASSVTVSAPARYYGAFGAQVVVTSGAVAYVEDESPSGERRYRARFYLNLNGLTIGNGEEFELFTASSTDGTAQLRLLVSRASGQNRLRLSARRDDGTFLETPAGSETVIPREWHSVEIDWRASVSPAASDGAMAVWVDGASRPGLTGIENDGAQVASVRWGAVGALDAGTTGSFLLDEFESRRDTRIGLLSVFQDVPPSHLFWPWVQAMYNSGVTSGCGNSNYCPSSNVTRDQMSIFLLRAREGTAFAPAACTSAPFGDVPANSPFCPWIRELVARGVTGGCGGGNFCPSGPVTRAEMAVFLLVTQQGSGFTPPPCTSAPFGDVPANSPFCPWIRELVARGITAGCGGGNYCPATQVSRGQMAVFLSSTFNLSVPTP